MGLIHFGVPENIALFLKKRLGLKTFVETGTFSGVTAAWASQHFERVYTIEASEDLWRSAKEKHRALNNVEFVLGNSAKKLPMLRAHFEKPLFWLDAHWSSGKTAGEDAECPLLSELEAIAESGFADTAILIDDARYILAPPPSPHKWEHWPNIDEVISAINRCGDFFTVVKDDVIIAIPGKARHDFIQFIFGEAGGVDAVGAVIGAGQKTALNRFLRTVKNHTYPNRVLKRTKTAFTSTPDDFLDRVKGVIHVGANTGQERDAYARRNLDVLWIEPIPDVFNRLTQNIACYPKQKAVNALVTDKEGEEYTFNLSNNDGLSSSIFDFKRHKEIWPDIDMISRIKLRSRTLDSIMSESRGRYDALVLDTQGSELLVLKGAGNVLRRVRFIKTEAADFEVYQGCTTAGELTNYLRGFDFRPVARSDFAATKDGHYCCDLTFEKSMFLTA